MEIIITEDNSTEENAVTVVIVEKENAPQMGVINVEKTGEYLASVVDTKDMSQSCLARRPSTRTLTVDLAGEMEATQQTTSSQGVSL